MQKYELKKGTRKVEGDLCHTILAKEMKHSLGFDEATYSPEYKKRLKEKLSELLGMDAIAANACPLDPMIESEEIVDGYKRIRFTFESERGAVVPCYLLVPDTGKEKYPVAIILQGHSSGFHNSIGVPKNDSDKVYIETRGDFGVQAVKNGYAALCIEQRAMGERTTTRHTFGAVMCTYPTLTGFMLGRTTLGERIWDIQRAIDILPSFDMLDTDKILVTGNSGGGTMSFYAGCMEERIKLSAPSCSFCSYETSILDIYHCACNYIPNAYKYFEMQDLAALIAPRNFIVFTGANDKIFPLHGVKKAFETVEKIYEKENAADKCSLVVTERDHYWCKDITWKTINEETAKMGW